MTKLSTSLPLRTAAFATLVLLAAAAVAVEWLSAQSNRALSAQTEASLQADARLLQAQFDAGGIDRLAARVDDLSRAGPPGLFLLQDAPRRHLAGNLSEWPTANALDAPARTFRYTPRSGTRDDTRLAVGLVVTLPDSARLLIARDIEEQRRWAAAIRHGSWLGFGALAALATGLGLYMRRQILTRVARITATSEAIMAGNLGERVPRDYSRDEFDRLSDNLNAMLGRIEELMTALSEVSDNIAHDLRTPLNRLRNQAEAALRDPGNGAAQRVGLEHVIEQADDLIKTFNALLLIARLGPGAAPGTLGRVELGPLVAGVVDLYEPVAEEARLTLTSTLPTEPIIVRANEQLLGQALANLVDNAIKYSAGSSHPGSITVTVTATNDLAIVTVGDRGPGIAPDDRDRALKRFVRLEKSRSQPGTGLGLSLVAAVARAHGATLELGDNAPGLKVTLTLKRD